ncbi:MAG: SGNH/GDSL hydrolase family protein [Candidatus Aminicenantales bacterium]
MQIRVGRYSILLLMPFFIAICSSSPRGVIILCAGDSITAEAYPHFLQRILNKEGFRARVLNYGRSGNTSGEYLSFLEKNRDRMKAKLPDYILLQLGTNDVRADLDFTPLDVFKSNMRKIIRIFRGFRNRTGKTAELFMSSIPPVPQNTPFPFTRESVARVTSEINPAIEAICLEEKVHFVDNYALFLNEPSLLPGVHPSREGYLRLAQNWFQFLKPFMKLP